MYGENCKWDYFYITACKALFKIHTLGLHKTTVAKSDLKKLYPISTRKVKLQKARLHALRKRI